MGQNHDFKSEEFLGNIAEELGNISGDITEIKQAQVNCATTDDLNNFKQEIADYLDRRVGEFTAATDAQSEKNAEIAESVNTLTDTVTKKIDDFTANPPVQEVHTTYSVAPQTWAWWMCVVASLLSIGICAAAFLWQEGRIERCRISDIKYHYILMHNGVTSEGLDSIESWFRNPDFVKWATSEVKAFERRRDEAARKTAQRYQLEEQIDSLNRLNNPKSNNKKSKK